MRKSFTLIALTLSLLSTTACMAVKAQSSAENEIEYQGYDRRYLVYVPSGYKEDKPIPLVIALHGGMGNGQHFMKSTGLDKTAEKHNFIVVFPNGTARFDRGHYTWNAGSCCGYAFKKKVDDVGFIRKLVSELEKQYNIDRNRIFATGFSNGGGLAYRLACEASDLITGIAVVSSSLDVKQCKMEKPVSVLHIHGTADTHNPYDGGVSSAGRAKITKNSTKASLEAILKQDKCDTEPQVSKREDLVYYNYRCPNNVKVEHIKIEGGGHAWPGAKPPKKQRKVDPTSPYLKTNEELWSFFSQVGR